MAREASAYVSIIVVFACRCAAFTTSKQQTRLREEQHPPTHRSLSPEVGSVFILSHVAEYLFVLERGRKTENRREQYLGGKRTGWVNDRKREKIGWHYKAGRLAEAGQCIKLHILGAWRRGSPCSCSRVVLDHCLYRYRYGGLHGARLDDGRRHIDCGACGSRPTYVFSSSGVYPLFSAFLLFPFHCRVYFETSVALFLHLPSWMRGGGGWVVSIAAGVFLFRITPPIPPRIHVARVSLSIDMRSIFLFRAGRAGRLMGLMPSFLVFGAAREDR